MNDGDIWHVWVDYDGAATTLEVRLSQSSARPTDPAISVLADLRGALGETVYIGFTAGTGGAYGNHDILALQFEDEFNPIGSPEVAVDIKPGSDRNPVNLRSKGVIPVAILTTEDFDATTIDPATVRFGPDEASEAHGEGHIEDVDHDGDNDLVLHFKTSETGIQVGDEEARITGQTFDGQDVEGGDVIDTGVTAPVHGRGRAGKPVGESSSWGLVKSLGRE